MKKSRLLVATLTAATFAIGCGALVACGDDSNDGDNGSNIHTVTFDANGGTYANSQTTTALQTNDKGVIVAEPEDPEREDWSFVGYNLKQDGSGVTITFGANGYKFTSNTTVYAQWEEDEEEDTGVHDITLDPNGGTLTGAAKVQTANGKLTSLPKAPTPPANKKFKGWYTAKTGGSQVTTGTPFTQAGTIYAQWDDDIPEETGFTITLNVGENGEFKVAGTANTLKTDEDGKLEELPEVEAKGDYKFLGWYTDETGGEEVTTDTEFEENSNIYARYVLKDGLYINNHLVAELTETTAQYGAQRQFGATGVKLSAGDVVIIIIDGKQLTHNAGTLELHMATDFKPHGVNLNQNNGTFTIKPGEKRDFYIYARYYPNATTADAPCWSIDFSDGESDPLILNGSYLVGTGFTNASWLLSADNYIDPTNGLIVEFEANAEFKITSCSNVNNSDTGRAWDHNDPSHYSMAAGSEGLEFGNIGSSGGGSVTLPGKYRITVTGTGASARFKFANYVEEYTITLDVGDGELGDGVDDELETVGGKLANLPTPAAPSGKMFDGWYTAATGGTKITASTEFTEDGTIYAQYKDIPNTEFTITFNAGEHGTCATASAETVNGRLASLPEVTVDNGYEFLGWYTAAENGDLVDTSYDFTGSVTLHAQYKAATTVTISTQAPRLHIGDTLDLQVTTQNFDGTLAWKSSSAATVSVTAAGKITAVKPGTATITVTAGKATATLEVTVVRDYYLRGSMMGWNPAVTTLNQSGIIYFEEDAETHGLYRAVELDEEGNKTTAISIKRNAEFKIASVKEAWDNKITGEQFDLTGLGNYFELVGDAGDKNLKCKDSAKYSFTLNVNATGTYKVTVAFVSDLPDGVASVTNLGAYGDQLTVGWGGTPAANKKNFTQGSDGKWTASLDFTFASSLTTNQNGFQFRCLVDGTEIYIDNRCNKATFTPPTGITATMNGSQSNFKASSAVAGKTFTVTITITEAGDVESIEMVEKTA